MKCPHCLEGFHSDPTITSIDSDAGYIWKVKHEVCPECHKIIIKLGSYIRTGRGHELANEFFAYPKANARKPLPSTIPPEFTNDYNEACLVLNDSPKASAALSRRCLQHILREKAGIKKGELFNEIQEVLESKQLPSYLSENLDIIRKIGKFAAHPNKSKATGEIVDVEPHEAEWNLDVLEGLFDFYFIQSEDNKQKRALLDKKIQDAQTKKTKS